MSIPFVPSLRRTAFALGIALAPVVVLAQHAPSPRPSSQADIEYKSEVARCKAGQSGEDQATCLREAAAARQQALQGGLADQGNYSQNALARCNSLPASERQDCVALMRSPQQSAGSVESGGVLRVITVPASTPAAPAQFAPAPGWVMTAPAK